MKRALHWLSGFISIVAVTTAMNSRPSKSVKVASKSGLEVTLDRSNKTFHINVAHLRWTFGGNIHGTIFGQHVLRDSDHVGTYREIVFSSVEEIRYRCSIRVYDRRPVVLFRQEALDSLDHSPAPFPVISRFPSQHSLMTYSEREFGTPPVFCRFDTPTGSAEKVHSGPLVLFDSLFNTCIISPASNFMVASISEDGKHLSCGSDSSLRHIPRGFTQSSILVVEHGINRTWETWGRALTEFYQKKRPSNQADVGLKYLSYWTDNGAFYYYNYDTAKGYNGTLLGLKQRYDDEHVPIRSMQLDSWWYEKGYDNPDGSIERSDKRIPELPAGTWNRFGGLLQYSAPGDLFPGGLRQFHDSLGLPLITHSRWISRDSPYRREYTVSGIGAVDQRWWDHIMKSISSWGVATYEQDWLDRIYENSPDFSSTAWAAETFMDDMASAARRYGLTMQYCMPLPRHYLQGGAKYSNLTSIRVSDDRFQRDRWKAFLYGSRLASALGIWPWSDVFVSRETTNMLLATLSAGVVGIGDASGEEDMLNILKSVRSDGVIVKPDEPLVPVDRSYLNDVDGKGLRVATTFTDHGKGVRTLYVFAYSDSATDGAWSIVASDIGVPHRMFSYDYFAGTGNVIEPRDTLHLKFAHDSCCYLILSPIARNGIAVIGDLQQFVPCGKQRIERLVEGKDEVKVTVLAAKGDTSVEVCGYSARMPRFAMSGGSLTATRFNDTDHVFRLEIKPGEHLKYEIDDGDPVGQIVVELRSSS